MLRRPARGAARLARDRRGAAIVEFAVILPLMLSIWAGMSEIAHAIDEWRKLTLYARTLADLTAQGDAANPLDAGTLGDFVASAALVMRPFSTSAVKVKVSALGVDTTKYGTNPLVCSSYANANDTARTVGAKATDLTVPPGYTTTGIRYILAEVSIAYTPMIGSALSKLVTGVGNGFTLATSFPWPARGGAIYGANTYTEVILPGASPKACDGSSP